MAQIEEKVKGQANRQEMSEFVNLMQQVEALPEEQQAKVTYFAQGVLAATMNSKKEKQR